MTRYIMMVIAVIVLLKEMSLSTGCFKKNDKILKSQIFYISFTLKILNLVRFKVHFISVWPLGTFFIWYIYIQSSTHFRKMSIF